MEQPLEKVELTDQEYMVLNRAFGMIQKAKDIATAKLDAITELRGLEPGWECIPGDKYLRRKKEDK